MRLIKLILTLLLAAQLAGCILISDAATRLASDIEDGARSLMQSPKKELEIEHSPLSFPDGVSGDYFIWLQAVDENNSKSGTLAVGALEGQRYGTSAHLHFVTVNKELRVRKKKGEVTYLLLRKTELSNENKLRGQRSVEVVSIR